MQQPQFDRSMDDLDEASASMKKALKKLRAMGAKERSPDETHLSLPAVTARPVTNNGPKRDTAWQKIKRLFG